MKHIILGITGSIAAYKAVDIANRLTKDGNSVHVIMTKNAEEFITPLTLQTITKNKVHTDMFEPYVPSKVEHISLAQQADLFLVAPATANFIAKAAMGMADDMLTTVLLATQNVSVLVAPAMNTAMNTAMYENPLTKRNMKLLSEVGFQFVEPREDRLACGDLGKGALAEVDVIVEAVRKALGE